MAINFTAVPGNMTCLSSGIKVCCADWEKRGQTLCYPCSRGYTSEINGRCLPCVDDMYGERCRFQCRCTTSEMCHHVYGCITTATNVPTGRQTPSQYSEVTSYGNLNDGFSRTATSTAQQTLQTHPFLGGTVNVYTLIVACLFLVICLITTVKKYRNYKRSRDSKTEEVPVPDSQQNRQRVLFIVNNDLSAENDNGGYADILDIDSMRVSNQDEHARANRTQHTRMHTFKSLNCFGSDGCGTTIKTRRPSTTADT